MGSAITVTSLSVAMWQDSTRHLDFTNNKLECLQQRLLHLPLEASKLTTFLAAPVSWATLTCAVPKTQVLLGFRVDGIAQGPFCLGLRYRAVISAHTGNTFATDLHSVCDGFELQFCSTGELRATGAPVIRFQGTTLTCRPFFRRRVQRSATVLHTFNHVMSALHDEAYNLRRHGQLPA